MMKDKLVKHNHRFVYFVMRKIAIVAIVVIGVGGVIAIPTYISLNSAPLTSGKAEENSSSETPASSSSILETDN